MTKGEDASEFQSSSDSAAIVDREFACVVCGYNLRGLSLVGSCPECGKEVAFSMRGHLLRYADVRYLAAIHRGVILVLAAMAGWVVVTVFAIIVVAAEDYLNFDAQAVTFVGDLIGITISAILAYGSWLFTSPDSGFVGEERATTPRRLIRIAVVVGFSAGVIGMVIEGIGWLTGRPAVSAARDLLSVYNIILIFLACINFAAGIVQFFSALLYVSWAAKRVPDEVLAKRARRYMWQLPLYGVGGSILAGIGVARFGLAAMFLLLLPLCAFVMYWNLLDRVRRHIKAARVEAGVSGVRG